VANALTIPDYINEIDTVNKFKDTMTEM